MQQRFTESTRGVENEHRFALGAPELRTATPETGSRLCAMADGEVAIVVAGRREDWPGGTQTLTARNATREPNGTLWFGADLNPAGDQVWFRIDEEAISRMPGKTAEARGRQLVDALLNRTNLRLKCAINRFWVQVSETGDTFIEPLRW